MNSSSLWGSQLQNVPVTPAATGAQKDTGSLPPEKEQGWAWPRVSRFPAPVPELALPVGWREPQAACDSGRHILTCPAERRPLSSPTPAQETTCPQQL